MSRMESRTNYIMKQAKQKSKNSAKGTEMTETQKKKGIKLQTKNGEEKHKSKCLFLHLRHRNCFFSSYFDGDEISLLIKRREIETFLKDEGKARKKNAPGEK